MSAAKNPANRPSTTSRREFLKTAAKGGSIAALIASGALDFELKNMLLAQELRTGLTKEGLTGALPSRSLQTIRSLLLGEYYFPDGRYFRGPRFSWTPRAPSCDPEVFNQDCPPVSGDVGECSLYCNGHWDCPRDGGCPSDCLGQGCEDFACGNHVCPAGHQCSDDACSNDLCGGKIDEGCWPTYITSPIDTDSRNITAFNLSDLSKNANTAFVKELMAALKVTSTRALEKEVKGMIKARQTLRMRGLVK